MTNLLYASFPKLPSRFFQLYNVDASSTFKAGSFAMVHYGTRKSDGLEVAIKIINQDNNPNHPSIQRQVTALQHCKHPNIIHFIDAVNEGATYVIVMERGEENLSVYRNKKERSMQQFEEIMQQIIGACEYLYRNDIMHRDLKLENIVKVGKLWKLVDFGFAYEGNIDDPVVKSRLGNKYGRAPEILEGRNYNYKSDIWSLGVLCYKLVYNRFPFELGGVGDLDRMKLNPFQTQLVPKGVRERNIQSFISRCLTYKPEDRINWEDIMRHPIMNDSLLDDILVSEIHHTMSGEIVDVDLEIISEIFEQT